MMLRLTLTNGSLQQVNTIPSEKTPESKCVVTENTPWDESTLTTSIYILIVYLYTTKIPKKIRNYLFSLCRMKIEICCYWVFNPNNKNHDGYGLYKKWRLVSSEVAMFFLHPTQCWRVCSICGQSVTIKTIKQRGHFELNGFGEL